MVIPVLLVLLAWVGTVAMTAYVPSLPALPGYFGTTAGTAQLTVTLFLLGFAAGQLSYGPFSDRFGRRPVLIAGMTLFFAASILCTFAPSIELLIAGRFLQGTGATAGFSMSAIVIRDLYEREQAARIMGYIQAAGSSAPAFGPLIGGQFEQYLSWHWTFGCMAVLAGALLAGIIARLPETNAQRNPRALDMRTLLGNYRTVYSSRLFIGYAVIIGTSSAGILSFTTGGSFYFIDRLGYSPQFFAIFPTFNVIAMVAGALIAGRYSVHLGVPRMLAIGTSLTLVGGLLTAGIGWAPLASNGIPGIIGFTLPFMIFLLGMGICQPNAMAGALAPYKAMAGLAGSGVGILGMVFSMAASTGISLLNDGTPLPMVSAIGLCGLLSFLAFRLLVRPLGRHGIASKDPAS